MPAPAAERLLKMAEESSSGSSDPNLQRATEIFKDWLTTRRHTVQRAETLSGIARKYNVPLQDLQKENGLTSTFVRPGQVIRIPVARKPKETQNASSK